MSDKEALWPFALWPFGIKRHCAKSLEKTVMQWVRLTTEVTKHSKSRCLFWRITFWTQSQLKTGPSSVVSEARFEI